MKDRNSLIGWELLLLFASVLVFRSASLLLDEMIWARETTGLLALLLPGVVLCIFAQRAPLRQIRADAAINQKTRR